MPDQYQSHARTIQKEIILPELRCQSNVTSIPDLRQFHNDKTKNVVGAKLSAAILPSGENDGKMLDPWSMASRVKPEE